MGQQHHSVGRSPLEPSLPRAADTEKDAAEHPSTAPTSDEPQTVPELVDALADKMDHLLDEAKQLVRQLRDT